MHNHKTKIIRRIIKYSELYKNDYDSLHNLDLDQLKRLQQTLLIPLKLNFAFKTRHRK